MFGPEVATDFLGPFCGIGITHLLSKRGEFVSTDHDSFSRKQHVGIGSVALILGLLVAALVMAPATALGQATSGTPGTSASPSPQATAATAPAVSLSSTSGQPGTSI